jgi:hypothetical protein
VVNLAEHKVPDPICPHGLCERASAHRIAREQNGAQAGGLGELCHRVGSYRSQPFVATS